MKAKAKYYFRRNYNSWAVYYDVLNEELNYWISHKVFYCFDYAEAVEKTYELNGWGKPKNIRKKY